MVFRCLSQQQYFDRIQISINIWSALVWYMIDRSQWNFAHVMTVTLSWRVQNFVVIGRIHFKPEHCKFWLNFECNRNIISGTGTRTYAAIMSLSHSDLYNGKGMWFSGIFSRHQWFNMVVYTLKPQCVCVYIQCRAWWHVNNTYMALQHEITR